MTRLMSQEKQRISERLERLDAEREKLSGQLIELEIAERVVKRFGGNPAQPGSRRERTRRRRPRRLRMRSAERAGSNGRQQCR